MNHPNSMRTRSTKNHVPFICRLMPSVGLNNPVILPFVCCNRPFIEKRGFTLIELLITLTVAGILLTVAAPSMWNFLAGNRLTSQVNDLVSDMSFARSEAIKRNGTVVICKSTNPTAATPTCDQTAADPWQTGRLIFFDNEDSAAGIALNNKYLAADGDVLLRVSEPLDGNATLKPNSSSVSPNLSNYLAFTKYGLTTLATPTAADGPHRFKICDSRGKVRGILLETTGRTALVPDGATSFTWSGTTYNLTCP